MSDTFAHINETITCVGVTDNYGSVTGVSGAYGYNISLLSSWGSGNFHGVKGVSISSRDARKFASAVRYAEDENLIGKRSAFSCAEVNAVTLLIGKGASLNEISLRQPLGSDRRNVNYCAACQCWMKIVWS